MPGWCTSMRVKGLGGRAQEACFAGAEVALCQLAGCPARWLRPEAGVTLLGAFPRGEGKAHVPVFCVGVGSGCPRLRGG